MLVDAELAIGDLPAARGTAARLWGLAEAADYPAPAALAAIAAAHVACAAGERDCAVSQLERALHLLAPLPLPLEAARTRLELARLLAAQAPDVAIAEARTALGELDRLGASADADAAASLLRSLGVSCRGGTRASGALTRREQEVLALLGLGLSNPEIAKRLFISRKTAAHHVSNVLAKLGLRNRAEAALRAREWQSVP